MNVKQVTPTGKMSNLVGLYFIKFKEGEIKNDDNGVTYRNFYQGWIKGKVDDEHYLAQAIDFLAGKTNVIKIVHVSKMIDWLFFDDADELEYYKERHRRGAKIDIEL